MDIFTSRRSNSNANIFVGEVGRLFYDQDIPILRLSDGSTPGGIIIAGGSGINVGPQGNQGIAGIQGPQGTIGPQGPQGVPGSQGNSSTVSPILDFTIPFLFMGA